VAVGEGVGVAVGVAVGEGVGVGVAVGVAVGVGVGDGVEVGVGVGDGVEVGEGVGATVGVGVAVGVGDPDEVGVGSARRFCGFGVVCIRKSATLLFVSVALPSVPPGRRSMLDPLVGAVAGAPSTKAFVASPHPTASTTSPPIALSATAPPVAANPPLYVASAIAANEPVLLATSRWRPGCSIVDTVHDAFRVIVPPVEVTYTSSSPLRSTADGPAFVNSANSSDAETPPVTTSETSRVEVGQPTAAASRASGRGAAARPPALNASAETAMTTSMAAETARRTRSIDDLPAGSERANKARGGRARWL
jgi:hypothetical protein